VPAPRTPPPPEPREELLQIDDLRAFASLIAAESLRRMNATLRREDLEDLVSYLCERALVLAPRFDPSYGYAFTTFLSRRLRFAVIEWFRRNLGDSRYGNQKAHVGYLPLHTMSPDAAERYFVEPEPVQDDMHAAVEDLGRGLSAEAQETLALVAAPRAQGWRPTDVMRASGISLRAQTVRLKALQRELDRAARRVERTAVPRSAPGSAPHVISRHP
jgi:hypothetical protein